jgi:hypothetical protein
MSTIRIVQYFELLAFTSEKAAKSFANSDDTDTITQGSAPGTVIHRYQNYFVNQQKRFNGKLYGFVPFRAEGTVSNIGGDNNLLQVLFPNVEIAIRLVEQGNGNRLSRLKLTTEWLNENNERKREPYRERYLGIGASFSETTIELRFRSAMDSVGATFPARSLTRNLVGILPLNSDLRLQ